ncbi:MAG: tyrosine-type recombinase/integrase, partial [Rhodospirillaceae bacterium]|nr:tyrosine-type recombinase/integrase [Rhodospirillaceae bacterium]
EAWKLGLMDGEDCQRALSVPSVKGSRLPAGRALDTGELRALFAACRDGTPAGARDAAAFALMFGCGLRRAEAVAVRVEDHDAETGQIRVIGKGNKERTVYASNGGGAAIEAWLAIRGDAPGPILSPVLKGGRVSAGESMTAQALMMRLKRRARQAAIGDCSPHDLRRTFVSAALEGGADLAMVQALAGHANPATTARYDRRPEDAKRRAAQIVHVPFEPEAAA